MSPVYTSRLYQHHAGAFGRRLAAFREKKGITQAELGNRTGLTASWVCHYERGSRSPNLENLVRLADALDLTVGELLGFAV